MKRIVLQNTKYLARYNRCSFSTCLINKNTNIDSTLEKNESKLNTSKKPQVTIKPVSIDEEEMSRESYFNKPNSGLNTSEKVGSANPGIYDAGGILKDKSENVTPRSPGANMFNASQETGDAMRKAQEGVADLKKMGRNVKENIKENVKEKASDMNKNVKQTMNKAKEMKDEAMDKTQDMTTKVRDKTIQYKEEAKDKMEDVKDTMSDAMERGKEKATTMGEAVTETVKEAASIAGQKAKEMKDKVVEKVNEWTSDTPNRTGTSARP